MCNEAIHNSTIRKFSNALEGEREAVRNANRGIRFNVNEIKISKREAEYIIYKGIRNLWQEGASDGLVEGVKIRLIYTFYDHITRSRIEESLLADFLHFDPGDGAFYFKTNATLSYHEVTRLQIEPISEQLIDALIERWQIFGNNVNGIGWPLFCHQYTGGYHQAKGDDYWHFNEANFQGLNQGQKDVIRHMYEWGITFLWGPPGTGKTTVIGHAIKDLLTMGKRVLAVALSNVAVDQMVVKYASVMGDIQPGTALRYGHPSNVAILKDTRFFPENVLIDALRMEIQKLNDSIYLLEKRRDANDELAILKARLQNKKFELRAAIKRTIHNAKITFTTASQVVLEQAFHDELYDMVIIDESSMMSIPWIGALSQHSTSKLLIAGDYKQLGPIIISKDNIIKELLGKTPFSYGDSNTEVMLTEQHRMHPKISKLVSTFYLKPLIDKVSEENIAYAHLPKPIGEAVVFVEIEGAECKQDPDTGSRYNLKNSEIILELAKRILRRPQGNDLAIITPYRRQAHITRVGIQKMVRDERLNTTDKKWRVDTIHKFQGSEAGVVIFDLVDTYDKGAGLLYQGTMGEYLFNVALSRAKGKLIVVGDRKIFEKNELVSQKLRKAINSELFFRVS